MTLTIPANQRIMIPSTGQRKALALYLASGSAVWGWSPVLAFADALGSETLTDPGFDVPDSPSWVKTGWLISGSNAVLNISATGRIEQRIPHLPAGEYEFSWNVATGTVDAPNALEIGIRTADDYDVDVYVKSGATAGSGTYRLFHRGGPISAYAQVVPGSMVSSQVVVTTMSLDPLTASAGIPLPLASAVTLVGADHAQPFAPPIYLTAGPAGASVILQQI